MKRIKKMFDWMLKGMTIKEVREKYGKELEESFNIEENQKRQSWIHRIFEKWYPIWLIVMIVIIKVFCILVIFGKNIKWMKDIRQRWSWFTFFTHTFFASIIGYIWAWRCLHFDILTRELFGVDNIPAWFFQKHTVISEHMFLGFSIEDNFFYWVGCAFCVIFHFILKVDKCEGVDPRGRIWVKNDFKYKDQIAVFYISLTFCFCLFSAHLVDFASRTMVECFGYPGIILFAMGYYKRQINMKNYLKFFAFFMLMIWAWDFSSTSLGPILAEKFPNVAFFKNMSHMSMWTYSILGKEEIIRSKLFCQAEWAWFWKREPFSILFTFGITTIIWSAGMISCINIFKYKKLGK